MNSANTCFHCGLENPANTSYSLQMFGEAQYFCCAGCLAIAETLKDNHLTDFYRFRSATSNKANELLPPELSQLESLDSPEILENISEKTNSVNEKTQPHSNDSRKLKNDTLLARKTNNGETREIILGIEGITCAACGWLIEKQLKNHAGVDAINVNVTTQKATLVWHDTTKLSDIIKSIARIGYRAYPYSEDARIASFEQTNKQYIKRLAVAGFGMMQVMTYAIAIYFGDYQDLAQSHKLFFMSISAIVATPVVFYSAKPFFKSAWQNLKARRFGMNFPVSIAIASAYLASCYSLFFDHDVFYFDSVVMFTFFLLIGRFLEHRARYRSILKQQNFRELVPLTATRLVENKSDTASTNSNSSSNCQDATENVPIAKIVPNNRLIVYAGETIPVDGILCENPAEVNEAIITGEYLPVSKKIGDRLISGSQNNSATLIMKVTADHEHSRVKSLIQLQQDAEQVKPDVVTLADKISHWYVTGLLTIVVIAALVWWQIDPDQVFPIALSILVVSCPCALSLATPATVAAATAQLSDMGLLVKSKNALLNLATISDVLIDKTGTLTTGNLQLDTIDCHGELSEKHYLSIAALLENHSNHPIAMALKNKAKTQILFDGSGDNQHSVHSQQTDHIQHQEIIGQGVIGKLDGKNYLLGNQRLLEDKGIFPVKELSEPSDSIQVYLADDKSHLATFTLNDRIRKSSFKLVEKLKALGKVVTIVSGDGEGPVQALAKQLKVSSALSGTTPEEKFELVQSFQNKGKNVLMIGDGFNDVGALAAANVSISIGSATNVSQSASDAVLVSKNLNVIAKALALSNKTKRIIRQNLSWAIIYNLTAIPFAVLGYIPAWLAAIGMSFSSLIVVLNALRLRK